MTACHFDHVGILLRFGDIVDNIYILESVSEDGVRLTSWLTARIYVGDYFEKIGFRKLSCALN